MVISCLDEYLKSTTKFQHKGRIQILEYLIKIEATRKVYDHCLYGKFHPTWLCARVGAPSELKLLLEDSSEGLDFCDGEHEMNALTQAFLHLKPEFKVPNVKLLLEYGANPNVYLHVEPKYRVVPNGFGLTPLHLVIAKFLGGEASLEDTEILLLTLLRSKDIFL